MYIVCACVDVYVHVHVNVACVYDISICTVYVSVKLHKNMRNFAKKHNSLVNISFFGKFLKAFCDHPISDTSILYKLWEDHSFCSVFYLHPSSLVSTHGVPRASVMYVQNIQSLK